MTQTSNHQNAFLNFEALAHDLPNINSVIQDPLGANTFTSNNEASIGGLEEFDAVERSELDALHQDLQSAGDTKTLFAEEGRTVNKSGLKLIAQNVLDQTNTILGQDAGESWVQDSVDIYTNVVTRMKDGIVKAKEYAEQLLAA